MANSKKKCRQCKTYHSVEGGLCVPLGFFCSDQCRRQWGIENAQRAAEQAVKNRESKQRKDLAEFRKKEKAERAKRKADRIRTERRQDVLDKLQDLVNQWVRYRDRDEPCPTCGTMKRTIKYDAGHCFTRGARPELRFELTNIHKQCSVVCNQHYSGRQELHKKFIAEKYGADHLAWLEDRTKHKSLKELFQDNESIYEEIARYRKKLRAVGIKPKW